MKYRNGSLFCNRCGNRIEDIKNQQEDKEQNKKKSSKMNKKIIYVIIGIIIMIVVAIVVIILGTNKNRSATSNNYTNENTNIEEGSTLQSEIKDFKYVQKDDNSPVGYSFTNIDFELFKDNVRRVWFKEDLEFDSIMERNKRIFGNNYSKWVESYTKDNYPGDEIMTYYTTTGTSKGPYSIAKSIILGYNQSKTNVVGIRICISDKYLGKMGRSKEMEYINEVIDCFPNDFKEDIYDRIDKNQYNGNDMDKEYLIQYGEETINGEDYLILAIIQKTDKNANIGDVSNKEQETNASIENNTDNDNATTTTTSSSNNHSNTQTSTSSNNSNNETKKEMVQVPWFSMGYELSQYTGKLDNLGIKYNVVKGQDLDYENNTVIKVEHNGEYVEKGSTITITVADNTYNMQVYVHPAYLINLAGFGEEYYNKTEYSISLKINGTNVFSGNLPNVLVENAPQAGTYKGKPDNLKIEATIEGKTITKEINYVVFGGKEPYIMIYAGGSIGLG